MIAVDFGQLYADGEDLAEILIHFSKKIAIKKEQKDRRVVSLCQGTWPHEVTATLEVQNTAESTMCVLWI